MLHVITVPFIMFVVVVVIGVGWYFYGSKSLNHFSFGYFFPFLSYTKCRFFLYFAIGVFYSVHSADSVGFLS